MHRSYIALGGLLLSACSTQVQVQQPSEPRPIESTTASSLLQVQPSKSVPSYPETIQLAVRRNLVLAEPIDGNPLAEVDVRTKPDGSIVDVTLVQSSGVPHWDKSVQIALWKTARIPLDSNGKVPSLIRMSFRPKPKP